MVTPVPATSAGISRLGIRSQRFPPVTVAVGATYSEIFPGTPAIPPPEDKFTASSSSPALISACADSNAAAASDAAESNLDSISAFISSIFDNAVLSDSFAPHRFGVLKSAILNLL